ncbi:MAG TPA: sigma-70 family RNA polymerase sigma factor [Anaeromyxobacteraceae bacterium]|nr:sigma-70 family RNA polymerase sigma factor [Anaeromyxobacteraceae bacterium]
MKRARDGGGDLPSSMRAIRSLPPLSREEEHVLALRARRGDLRARHALVTHHLAFVVMLARKVRRGNLRLEDLVQEGNLGLLRAVEKFDPHAGTRFLTYAAWWVRAYLGKYVKEARSSVRPHSGTVALCDLSLDDPSSEEGDGAPLDLLASESLQPEEACLAAESTRQVRSLLEGLRPHLGQLGWDIVRERLEQDSPKTLEEIGKRFGVSRERVRQVEVKVKRLLQHHLREAEVLTRQAA